MNTITLSKTIGGWKIDQHKTLGLNKGTTTLATFCGGNLGLQLALACAKHAAETTLADELVINDGVDVTTLDTPRAAFTKKA